MSQLPQQGVLQGLEVSDLASLPTQNRVTKPIVHTQYLVFYSTLGSTFLFLAKRSLAHSLMWFGTLGGIDRMDFLKSLKRFSFSFWLTLTLGRGYVLNV